MRSGTRRTSILAALVIALVTAVPAFAGGGPQNVLVVVNEKDADSVRIGEHYVKARGVPPGNLLRLRAPTGLTTDFATYHETIEEPIKNYLARSGLAAHVDYLVLTRGLPILTAIPGGNVSVAACLMVMDTPLSGQRQKMPMPSEKDLVNPFVGEPRAFSNAKKYGEYHLYLATMLTGYTAEDSIALVDRAIAAEEAGPPVDPLFIFQDASGNAGGRNRFYKQAMDRLTGQGRRVEHFKNGAKLVVGKKRVIAYMSGGSYSQIDEDGIRSNEYLPGAICDMLESFGAVPQNFDPKRKSQVPVTWFVRHGITGVHGAVAEPFAHTFPDVLLFERYAAGMNLAEAFHASIPFLYWKNLVIGDPLCTPFVSRPVVTISGVSGTASGTVRAKVSTRGGDVREIRLFVDGRLVGSAKGGGAELEIDTETLADGPHHLLATAVLPPPLEVQGWAATTFDVTNPDLVPIAARAGPEGTVLVRTNRPVDAAAVTAKIDGVPAKVEPWIGGESVKLVPGKTLPAGNEVTVALEGAATGSIRHVVAPARFVVEGPKTATAGEEIVIRIRAVDADGKTAAAYRGRVTVALQSPTVDAANLDPEVPEFRAAIRLQRAGPSKVRVFDRVTGVTGLLTVETTHGPPAGFSAEPSTCPLGVPFDLRVRLFDRYGNPATGFSGRLMLAIPSDISATIPEDADAKAGVAVFRGVIVTKAGRQVGVVRKVSGETIGRGTLRVTDFTERNWLVTGPRPERLAGIAGASPSEGHVIDGVFWRRYASPKNEVDLERALGGGKGYSYAALHFYLPAAAATRVTLGWGSRVTLYVDGKQVFASKKAEKTVKADRHVMRGFSLGKGWHRVLVESEHGGASDQFVFRITDDSGAPIRGLRTALAAPGETGVIEGRITASGAGVAGMELDLTGPARVRTRTMKDGRFRVGGLAAGKWTVTPLAKGLAAEPGTRAVDLGAEPAGGVDFTVRDEIPPEVSIESPADGARGGDVLEVVVRAMDNVKVTEVWISHDGARIGDVKTKAPWRFTVTAKEMGYRNLKLTAFATDAAGNRSESKPVRVRLIRDKKGPSIKVKHPRGTKPVTAKTNFQAEITDEIAVAEVEFHVNGRQLGKTLTAPRSGDLYEAPFDPKSVKKGTHTLVVKARDRAGNETKKTVRFKTK